jgi:cytochrome P450
MHVMAATHIPAGPDEQYRTSQDLLDWLGRHFDTFGDIYKASIYGARVYVIRDPQHAQHVLVENWQNYVKGDFIKRVAFLLGNGLMVSKGDMWKQQRRMIQPAFHGKVIGALTELITTANLALLEKWLLAAEKGQSVNVTRDVSGMVLQVVLASIFGQDYAQVEPHFSILSEEPARNLEFAHAFRSLGTIIIEVASRRRKENAASTDTLGMLIEARDPSGHAMTDRQLVDEILTLIVAGHETTASTLNWMWYLISQHPEVEARLSDQLDRIEHDVPDRDDLAMCAYSRHILDEALRLYPAGWLMTRRALNDDQLGDYFVPAGIEIYISPYFIQRHPDLWDDPNRFNPDRFSPEHAHHRHRLATMPFSAGPRNCIGESLARLEMQIHLMVIAKQLRLTYVPTRPLELEAGVNLRNKHDFIMTPVKRIHADTPA